MLTDDIYDLCLPLLTDESLEDEDKTDRLEDLLKNETSLTGKALENAVLDALWRFRTGTTQTATPPPSRHTVIRRPSPAPWQVGRPDTPSRSSPRIIRAPPGLTKSSTVSPFTSPRSSPRISLATPHIPHSPRLETYEFSEPSPAHDKYGDLGSDNVEWLVNDDAGSVSSFAGESVVSVATTAADWDPASAMDPYDLLRSILRNEKSNDEIEKAMEENAYDLSATITALMGSQEMDSAMLGAPTPNNDRVVVGKSMSPSFRPATPVGQQKSNILCKYWLSTGSCARADCRFSHDPSKTVCKYWLAGNCLAGENCLFSHDPSMLMARMMLDPSAATPPAGSSYPPSFQLQDYEAFPSLQGTFAPNASPFFPGMSLPSSPGVERDSFMQNVQSPPVIAAAPPGLNPMANFAPSSASRPQSRPGSRHMSRAPTPSLLSMNDDEAFPSLGSAITVKVAKKHHGKRGGHGHHNSSQAVKDPMPATPPTGPATLAELVRMSPAPSPAQARRAMLDKGRSRSYLSGSTTSLNALNGSNGTLSYVGEKSETARNIPPPENVPWLATGDAVNKAYLKARNEAFKHGGLRNKFLQSAAQAYNRHDSRAAKALSLRGQSENNLMREAHREAARVLYEERNQDLGAASKELYVDLHGLHPEESIHYLAQILQQQTQANALVPAQQHKPLYTITGTAHHSKAGRDKIGKAVRQWLVENRFAFREFSVPGDRGGYGGIIGIDVASGRVPKDMLGDGAQIDHLGSTGPDGMDRLVGDAVGGGGSTKVRILRREDVLGNGITESGKEGIK